MFLQLQNGKYQADLVIKMADDLLPPDISTKVKNVAQKCRDAGNGKFGLNINFLLTYLCTHLSPS
jgi:hypothetical protein